MEEKTNKKTKEYPFTATPKKIGGGSRYIILPSYFFNEEVIKEGQTIKLLLVVDE